MDVCHRSNRKYPFTMEKPPGFTCSNVILFLIFAMGSLVSLVESREPYHDLWKDLMADYDRRVRPVQQASQSVNLSFNVHVDHVIGLDARSETLLLKIWLMETWTDMFLKFNATEYQLEMVSVEPSEIWVPDLYLYESLDQESVGLLRKNGNALVHSDGTIFWTIPMISHSFCTFKVKDYPFDTQTCNLSFSSWVYSSKHMRISYEKEVLPNKIPTNSGEWDVHPIQCYVEAFDYGDAYLWDMVKCQLKLTRKPLFYIFNLVTPCILLLVIGSATFFLPVNCGEKVSLSITILLAMTVFVLVLMENLPPTSEGVPFLGKFVIACSGLLATSTGMAVSIVHISARGASGVFYSKPPRWLQCLVLKGIARLVFFNKSLLKVNEKNMTRKSSLSDMTETNIENSENVNLPEIVENEQIEQNLCKECHDLKFTGNDELWMLIAAVLDRMYFLIYAFLVLVMMLSAVVMTLKVK